MFLDIVIPFLALGAVFLVLEATVLGCVLMTCFLFPKYAQGRRIFIAVAAAMFLTVLPLLIVVAFDEPSGDDAGTIVLFGIILAVCGVSGWPAAQIATKRLDRMIKFDLETFE